MKCEHTKCVNNDDAHTSDPPLVQEAELGGGARPGVREPLLTHASP